MKNKTKGKKPQRAYQDLMSLGSAATIILTTVILLGVSGEILGDLAATQTTQTGATCNNNVFGANITGANCTAAFNATSNGQTGIQTFSLYMPVIGSILAAGIVIGLVIRYLGNRA